MSQISLNLLISSESLFDALSRLSLQEKRQMREWLDQQIAQAGIQENRTDYVAKDHPTTKEGAPDILEALKKLTLSERLTIVETALHLIREDLQKMNRLPLTQVERKRQLALAAKALLSDYTTDHELTSFTALDGEAFHESG